MAPRSLYDEALDRFRKDAVEAASSKERDLLTEFLHEKATPEETKAAAADLQEDAGKKWGGRKAGNVEIPGSWIANIMDNIQYFVAAGDFATKSAPESVGMAWYAVKITLTAIHSNYDLYTFFGTGLSDVSEIMILVRHYNQLYDERTKPQWKSSPVVEKLFQDVIGAYAAVLDFCFAIKCHLTSGALTRIKHGFKDFFGLSKLKFEAKLEAVATFKARILEESQGAFQDKTLAHLDSVSSILSGIEGSVRHIQKFQDTQKKLHEDAMAKFDVLIKGIDDIKASTKPKSRWDHAVQDFQKYQDALGPMEGCFKVLGEIVDDIYPGTCQWVFEAWLYQRWIKSTDNTMLCVAGLEGAGKSYIAASVASHLTRENDTGRAVLFVPCKLVDTKKPELGQSQTADSICHTLLSQLYGLAVQGEDNVSLLESCNAIFKTAKGKHNALPAHMRAGSSGLPDFADALVGIAALLQLRSIVAVLDGLDRNTPDNKNQEELLKKLQIVLKNANAGVRVHILVACAPSATFFSNLNLDADAYIDPEDYNGKDIELLLTDKLKDIPGLSKAEQETAKTAVLEKARGRFRYVRNAVIPFLQEPFQRPISKRLESLPDGRSDVYARALRKMSPNYLDLLRTALTWTILGKDYPYAREIMDAFQGTYDTPFEGDLAEEPAEFPLASRLELEQLRVATDGFLKLSQITEGVVWVAEVDAVALAEFFVKPSHNGHEDEHPEQLCSRCKSTQAVEKTLYIDKKEGHLQIALTCLRHLNHPLFQKRAGLLATTLEKEETDNAGEADEEAAASNGSSSESPEEVEPEDEPEYVEYASEASLDDEDVLEKTYFDYNPEDYLRGRVPDEDSDYFQGPVRYEMQHWPWHLRQAEELWSVEEREKHSDWRAVLVELDKLAFETPAVFAAWQGAFHEESDTNFGLFRLLSGPHSPLHVASYLGLTSWVGHLLERGEDLHGLSGGYSALQAAASSEGRLDTIKFLLQRGADANAENDVDRNAFHYWMLCGERTAEGVQVFLEHGADPTINDSRTRYSPFHYFSARGVDPKALDLLLAHDVDINGVDPEATGLISPLHYLLERRNVPLPLLRVFLAHGADTNAETSDSIRPLQVVVMSGQLEPLEIILGSKLLDMDDVDSEGTTALHQAAFLGFSTGVRKLAEHGADPDIPDKLSRIALHTAARKGLAKTVQVLLEHSKQPNRFDKQGWTPLFCACLSKNEETAVRILDALIRTDVPLAEINKPSRSGRTILRLAAGNGFCRVVSKLIQVATDRNDAPSLHIDARDSKKGMSPLHRAALNGHSACVRALLAASPPADVSLTDSQSRTALALAYEQWAIAAKKTSYETIISDLITADPQAATSDANLIAVCAANGSVKLLSQLCSLDADLSQPDRFGWTPLDLARQFGHKDAEAFLKQQAAWKNLLPSRWSTAFPAVTPAGVQSVVDDGKKIVHTSGKRVCVSADRPLPAGLESYYFEVSLLPMPEGQPPTAEGEFPIVAVGFCTLGGAAIEFPGWAAPFGSATTASSWGYHSDDGTVYSSAEWGPGFENDPRGNEDQRYRVGDTVGCGVDLGKGEMWFTKNGAKIRSMVRKGVKGRLFPVVGLREGMCFVTNFGSEEGKEFVWKGEVGGEGAVAKVVVSGAKDEEDKRVEVQVTSRDVVVVEG